MKIRHLLLLVSTAAMTALAWGQSEPLIGKKSKVTLSLTIQQTVGAFLVTDSQVARDEAKGITYEDELNPLFYTPPANGARYYTLKRQRQVKGTGESQEIVTTNTVSRSSVTQKYGTREFLAELALAGAYPEVSVQSMSEALTATRTYSLVTIRYPVQTTAGWLTHFFAERPNFAPVYLGYYNESELSEEQRAYAGPIYLRLAHALDNDRTGYRFAGVETDVQQWRTREIGGVVVEAPLLKSQSDYVRRIEMQIFPEFNGGGGYRYLIGAGQFRRQESYRETKITSDTARSILALTGFVGGYGGVLVRGGFTCSTEQIGVDVSGFKAVVPEALR